MTVLLVFDVWRDVCIRMDEKACIIGRAEAVKPVLDLANNMRMVLVPGKENFIYREIMLADKKLCKIVNTFQINLSLLHS